MMFNPNFNVDESLFPCDLCPFKTQSNKDLRSHLKSVHEGVKYPCDQCDYKATYKRGLLTHIKLKHVGV